MSDLSFEYHKNFKAENFPLLKAQLKYIANNSPFYIKMFRKLGMDIQMIKCFEDLQRLPITTKEDLQRFNSDFIAVPEDEIIDLVTTSGTLGSPVNFALNESDLQRLAHNEYRSFKMVGLKKSDRVQITTTLDRRFMAGLAYFLGLRKLGAGIIRTGSGLPQLQWESIERFKPTYLIAVPSFLLKMIRYAEEFNIDFKNSSVKGAICIGEPLRDQHFNLNALGQKISDLWDIELFSTYASTEMSTAFTECPSHTGNHVPSELIHIEILDEKGDQVKPGEIGELVVTPLGTRTMPLLRFATGDMLTYYEGTCACGRDSTRLGPVIGRKQQKIKYKGTSLYPQHIIDSLNRYERIETYIVEVRMDEHNNDELIVFVPEDFADVEELREFLRSRMNVSPEIKTMPLEALYRLRQPSGSRKPQIFRDLR